MDINIAKNILDAEYRPPAQKWDIMSDYLKGAREFILIDGVFLDEYPTPPKEIKTILDEKEATVWGASSMGALRAVELRNLGMKGVGLVYQHYLTGKVEDDDEVAVVFHRESGVSHSYPLINLRYTLKSLEVNNKISKYISEEILKIEKNKYFPFRNLNSIKETCNTLAADQGNELFNLIINNWIDLKALDAKLLLRKIRNGYQ